MIKRQIYQIVKEIHIKGKEHSTIGINGLSELILQK